MSENKKYVPEAWTKASATILEHIATNALERMCAKFKLNMRYPSVVHTTAIMGFRELAKYMGDNPDVTLDIGDLLIHSVNNRPDDKGEKAGNIVPSVVLGKHFLDIFENGICEDFERPAVYVHAEYPKECSKDIEKICEKAKVRLSVEHHLNLEYPDIIYQDMVTYLEEIAMYMKEHPDDVIDLGSFYKFSVSKGVPQIELGERFKLACKNDDSTEEDDA